MKIGKLYDKILIKMMSNNDLMRECLFNHKYIYEAQEQYLMHFERNIKKIMKNNNIKITKKWWQFWKK